MKGLSLSLQSRPNAFKIIVNGELPYVSAYLKEHMFKDIFYMHMSATVFKA